MTECIYYVFQWLHSVDIIRHIQNQKWSSCIAKIYLREVYWNFFKQRSMHFSNKKDLPLVSGAFRDHFWALVLLGWKWLRTQFSHATSTSLQISTWVCIFNHNSCLSIPTIKYSFNMNMNDWWIKPSFMLLYANKWMKKVFTLIF